MWPPGMRHAGRALPQRLVAGVAAGTPPTMMLVCPAAPQVWQLPDDSSSQT
jgi:hypothetical protein